MLSIYLAERLRYGLPEVTGPVDREALFLVDGVGGFQLCATMVRHVVRQAGDPFGTILFDWQTRLRGDIWSDLMRFRRNRRMSTILARKLLTFRRTHPETPIHIFAVSAGTGIAVLACERLKRSVPFDTLILACPALSPTYNLGPALRRVERCYALISRRDTFVLGLGTRVFGTIDRRHSAAAGLVGFRLPSNLSEDDRRAYDRLREIHWSEAMIADGHGGRHRGWVTVDFLTRHLIPMLRGQPRVPAETLRRVVT